MEIHKDMRVWDLENQAWWPEMLLTRPKWVALSLLHCVSLRNIVEFWEPSKLLPNSVVVKEGPHGIINVANETLWEKWLSGRQPPGIKTHIQPQGKEKNSPKGLQSNPELAIYSLRPRTRYLTSLSLTYRIQNISYILLWRTEVVYKAPGCQYMLSQCWLLTIFK